MATRTRTRRVHPVADLFPMLLPEDLDVLAADIAQRGLLHPIVLDADGQILDGRNRLAACEKAGVEPSFTTYEGDDPGGYALAVNIARRNLTKGQSAMVAAKAQSLDFKLRGVKATLGQAMQINKGQMSSAGTILEFAPDLVDQVISGAVPLDTAYATAKDRKRAKQDGETAMAELRLEFPELVEQVSRGDLSLAEALSIGRNRRKEQAQVEIDAVRRLERDTISGLELIHDNLRRSLVQYWHQHSSSEATGLGRKYVVPENLRKIGEGWIALAQEFEKPNGAAHI